MEDINDPGRSVADVEEDGIDHLGFETPRSGVATPRPDLHDKRLPGIATSFGQVGTASLKRRLSESSLCGALESLSTADASGASDPSPTPGPEQEGRSSQAASEPADSPLRNRESQDSRFPAQSQGAIEPLPPPTPPISARPSSDRPDRCKTGEPTGSKAPAPTARPFLVRHAASDSGLLAPTLPVTNAAPLTSVVTASAVAPSYPPRSDHTTTTPPTSNTNTTPTDANFSDYSHVTAPPTLQSLAQALPPTPSHSRASSAMSGLRGWFSLDSVKMLTTAFKSGTSTPTRALSAAQPSQAERNGLRAAESVRSQTPKPSRPSKASPAPAAKGKLTVKITEAKGIRRSRDPYVVVVFQRSELISGGPRQEDDGEETPPLPGFGGALGGVPIQRQDSDSGRPPMAIPMRSRQSSNTSVTEYNTFRNRTNRRSFANPKWDSEAVFDVVDSDFMVDISVYDHGANGEIFLGHVDVEASSEPGKLVEGWFSLGGHVNTVAEQTPTGEIYVEARFQRAERKHLGPEDFQILKLIGRGTFGQVYQVRKKDTERIYAMKVLSKKVIVQKKEVAHTVGERNILVRTATSDSPFIVGLKFSFQTPSDLYLVTDYMSGGELFWHLQKEGRFDEKRAKFYIAELILAIQHLHDNDIVYRDLKPENILLDANGHIALCDFGLSKANLTKNDTTNTFCGTTEYLAPEVLLDESGYTKMVDFWSLGVLVFEMCCGWSPFYADDTQQMYKNIAFGKVKFPQRALSQEGKNFVKGLLNRNPRHRLGAIDDAEELKRHPFFADIDWDLLAKKLISPPFKPKLKSAEDVAYFDPEFTNALTNDSSLQHRADNLGKGFAASTPLSPSVQANFKGFTYVDESTLEDHMHDRYDEDMNDSHRDQRQDDDDDDWDNLDDVDLTRGNRMSGIVATSATGQGHSADEHMLGHFEV
ncbi:related to protein kinase sck1, cAMP-dependent [Cephalotrichum gorgonifer]|uniref:non-specific serine/threonine protein kinase n=1 Tax=Cephalotrichum gorgonifer TaxID=2041049 RepID=A0AAE8SR36_9PEZI|nr:related to protein kinase sck1, cAMP-dependent [Cephalotrichum gorgonifer]